MIESEPSWLELSMTSFLTHNVAHFTSDYMDRALGWVRFMFG